MVRYQVDFRAQVIACSSSHPFLSWVLPYSLMRQQSSYAQCISEFRYLFLARDVTIV
jgi:hypothetical protein